jgi:RHS repeat-associated protein
MILNSSGGIDSWNDFYPFGMQMDLRNGSTSADARYKFTGKERDIETGYDYFGARYYDARIGRWMSVDPWVGKYPRWSPYNYSFDNPLRYIDPDGMGPDEVKKENKDEEKRKYDAKDGVKIQDIKVTNKEGKEVIVKVKFQDTQSDKHSSDNKVDQKLVTALEGTVKEAAKSTEINELTITATTNGTHTEGSLHYDGQALDIGAVNGKSVSQIGDADPVSALQKAFENQSGKSENYGPSMNKTDGVDTKSQSIIKEHKNHIHFGTD